MAAAGLFAAGLAATAAAQESDVARPGFLAAMGLLDRETVTIEHPIAPDFTIDLPRAEGMDVTRMDAPSGARDFIAAWEFVQDGLVETLTLTAAEIEPAPKETRQFAMANLLVLRSYGELAKSVEDSQLLTFGPVQREDDLTAVQAVGAFATEGGRRIVFRHIGLMAEGRPEAIVAILNIDPTRLTVRSETQLHDTYGGLAVASIRLTDRGLSAPAE